MTDQEARSFGFDMRGPDVGVDWSGRNGFACTCEWSSAHHGDTCPEHGKKGVPILSEADELRAEVAELRAENERLKDELQLVKDHDYFVSGMYDQLKAGHPPVDRQLLDLTKSMLTQRDEELAELRRVAGELATKLTEAIERMTRARMILTDDNPRTNCNWGMLDARDLSPALASYAKLTEAKS